MGVKTAYPVYCVVVYHVQVLTVSADKSAKIWAISEDGHGKVTKTLTCTGSDGFEDMLVGCLWHNSYLVTVSLGGTMSVFSATDLDDSPVILSGHMKNVNSVLVLKNNPNVILSCSYDGLIVKWTKGIGFTGKLKRVIEKIKCFMAAEEEIVTSGFDNKVIYL